MNAHLGRAVSGTHPARSAARPSARRLDGRVCPPTGTATTTTTVAATTAALWPAAAVLINYYSTELDFNALLL